MPQSLLIPFSSKSQWLSFLFIVLPVKYISWPVFGFFMYLYECSGHEPSRWTCWSIVMTFLKSCFSVKKYSLTKKKLITITKRTSLLRSWKANSYRRLRYKNRTSLTNKLINCIGNNYFLNNWRFMCILFISLLSFSLSTKWSTNMYMMNNSVEIHWSFLAERYTENMAYLTISAHFYRQIAFLL